MEDAVIPIHTIDLKDFTHPGGLPPVIADEEFCKGVGEKIANNSFLELIENENELLPCRRPSNLEGFSIAHIGQDWGNGLIAIWDDKTNQIVGGQANGVPYVLPEYRGKYLGREIQLRAFDTGLKTIHDGSFFSPGGLACRKSAHKFAVERALQQGIVVSDEVMADYPELTTSFKM